MVSLVPMLVLHGLFLVCRLVGLTSCFISNLHLHALPLLILSPLQPPASPLPTPSTPSALTGPLPHHEERYGHRHHCDPKATIATATLRHHHHHTAIPTTTIVTIIITSITYTTTTLNTPTTTVLPMRMQQALEFDNRGFELSRCHRVLLIGIVI